MVMQFSAHEYICSTMWRNYGINIEQVQNMNINELLPLLKQAMMQDRIMLYAVQLLEGIAHMFSTSK